MKNINSYKKLLEEEQTKLIGELETVARRNPSNPNDWEAIETSLGADSADENEVADEIEGYEENQAILARLEPQLRQVERALAKIKENTYGKCDVCQEEIPEARLKANPAATACLKHSK